ncbi:hypothetical protein GJR96_07295 [Haloferax sp. MBLA0076]|uniref:Uncharacterized protein n=1 Tax=Haloferax litoreum TaxID=2666140 RepID=A0A6A8GJ75_9EURY|nr:MULTISPECIES: hypothetical protein [Haloferax]KAB1193261.1 hypothetical protein Hfx1148_07290 [Haloferax sp. CBA1148]MRX21760.1 hypothetical protein [Haloferax litoreum]
MPTTQRRRALALLVLLGCLFGFVVWFGSLTPDPAVGAYPESVHLGSDYDAWVGERTSLTGVVTDTDPLTIVTGGGATELRVTDTDVDAHEAERLAVYGVVEPDHTVRALNAYTVPPGNYTYMYAVSFLAGLWVLGRLVRDWRVNVETWSLASRSTPRNVTERLDRTEQTEDHDA